MITYRKMDALELTRIGEIDRTEEVREAFVQDGKDLRLTEVHWSIPTWAVDGDGDNNIAKNLSDWSPLLEANGTMIGAFDGDTLGAFLIYRPDLDPGIGQLAVLYVSQPYRRLGLGRDLTRRCLDLARDDGAREVYVSAAPTKATVDFYLSLGFEPTDQVNPDLFELEPEDIHMRLAL